MTNNRSSKAICRSSHRAFQTERKLSMEGLESRRLFAVDLLPVAPAPSSEGTVAVTAYSAGTIQQPDTVANPIGSAVYTASAVRMFNQSRPSDVDGNGFVNPIDALRVIDALNRYGSQSVSSLRSTSMPVGFKSGAEGEAAPIGDDVSIGDVDTNGDGDLNPLDVLVVIDELNGKSYPISYMIRSTSDQEESTDPETSVDIKPTDFDFETTDVGTTDFITSEDEIPMYFDYEVPADLQLDEGPVAYMMSGAPNSIALFSSKSALADLLSSESTKTRNVDAAMVSYFSSNFIKFSTR